MKIVFIGPFGLQPKTTMSVRALPLAKTLVRQGHSVTMLIPPWDDPDRSGQSWEDDGVQIINVSLPAGLPLLFHIFLTRSLVAKALVLQPDVIHFFKPKAYAGLAHLILWWLRRLGGSSARLVVDEDDWEQAWNETSPYSTMQKKLFAWQERWGLSHADAVTVASRALEVLVVRYRPPDPSGIFYMPNGYLPAAKGGSSLDFVGANFGGRTADELSKNGTTSPSIRERWQIGQAPIVLLYTRFVEFRVERIAELVHQVAGQLVDVHWLIAGRGLQGEEQELAAQLHVAGYEDNVHFAGWLPVGEIPAYFAVADVVIFPYDDTIINRTKCSVKLIDLLAAGLPVVANAVGQNCEYIEHNVTGILVPVDDDELFAKAVIDLLNEPGKRKQLGQKAARQIREDFNWLHLSQGLERVYR